MCGIAGWVDWERDLTSGPNREILRRMTETLARRGPDGEGYCVSPRAALGHRRLSVVDPAGGAQPMRRTRDGKTYAVTYNGELYNTAELRGELTRQGCRFTTHCDTEVLLQAYIVYGAACVEKFNGIFAFGVWDEARQELFLARDRIGVKPLFYTQADGGLLFGSELKALLAHPSVKPVLDDEGLAEIFMIGPARTPGHGVFRGVNELKPGYWLRYGRDGLKLRQYWSLTSRAHTDDFPTTAETVRALLQDAVRRQMVADVPVCTFLSGGLDSSALTSLAGRYCRENGLGPLHTYAVDYVDNDQYFKTSPFQPNSDTPWAEKMAEYCGTIHHPILLGHTELAKALPLAARARDLPGMADVDTSLYLFAREIKRGATVALSGECADEVFGGYPWFYRDEMIRADTFPWAPQPKLRQTWFGAWLKRRPDWAEYARARYLEALAEVPRLDAEDAAAARRREIFYLSLTRWMPTLLDRKDRMSMAFGLEVRVPYCDHRLVEYVWNVPWTMKNDQNREKGLLRQALRGVLPEDVLWRKKSPYPKTHHPEYLALVRSWALDLLHDSASPLSELVDMDAIDRLAETDLSAANVPWFGQLMGGAQLFAYFIQMDDWLRHYQVQLK